MWHEKVVQLGGLYFVISYHFCYAPPKMPLAFATSCPQCGKNFKTPTCVLNHLNQPYSLCWTQYQKRLKWQQRKDDNPNIQPTDAPAVESLSAPQSLSVYGPAEHFQEGYFPMDISEGIDLAPHIPITQMMNQFQQLMVHHSSLKNILVHQKYMAMR